MKAHFRAKTEFGEVKLLEIFFSKFFLKKNWNRRLTQVFFCYFWRFVKMQWALKSPTSNNVNYLYIDGTLKKQHC